jgi:uncharacterized membrane protein
VGDALKESQERAIGTYVTILVIVVIGTWLRFRNLGADSIWHDEAISWLQAKGSLRDLIVLTAQDNYPPLHNLLLFVAMNVSGTDSEWVLRVPSALLGVGNIVAVYWLGVLIDGRITGLIAAAVLATSGFHIFESQEARMYALFALAATLYAAAAFFFVKFPTWTRAALVACCGLALTYSHAFGTLNWIAIAIGITANILLASGLPRRAIFQWAIANTAVMVGFSPWALIILQRARTIAGHFWVPYPSLDFVYTQLYYLMGGRLVAGALLIGAAVAIYSNLRASIVFLLWAVVPVGLVLIESLISTPVFLARYLIGALPAVATLGAIGIAYLLNRQKWPTTVAAVVILAAAIIGNLRYLTATRDDWRAAAAYLRGRLQDSDCVLVYPGSDIVPLHYYLRTEFCTFLPPLGSIAKFDVQTIKAPRTFVVLQPRYLEVDDDFQGIMSRYGHEKDHFDALEIEIIEYQR